MLVDLVKTLEGCPAEWIGTLSDGRVIYVRYRWGSLTAGVGWDLEQAARERHLLAEVGGPLDGEMGDDELAPHLALYLRSLGPDRARNERPDPCLDRRWVRP